MHVVRYWLMAIFGRGRNGNDSEPPVHPNMHMVSRQRVHMAWAAFTSPVAAGGAGPRSRLWRAHRCVH